MRLLSFDIGLCSSAHLIFPDGKYVRVIGDFFFFFLSYHLYHIHSTCFPFVRCPSFLESFHIGYSF